MSDNVTIVVKEPFALNLRRLCILRNIEIGAQLSVLALAVYVLEMPLPLVPMFAVILALALLSALTWLRLKLPRPVTLQEFYFQVVMDVLALTALLYFAGGSTNPFVSLFLLPMVIVAATLPRRYAWGMAALTIACYTTLMFVYVPLPHTGISYLKDFDLHIFGMWFGFLLGVGLIIFVAMKMATELRERDRILAEAREQALRDEHLVALGTLAAGAAHELGTPLATMAVLTRELEREHASPRDLPYKLKILRQQVDRCKGILSTISERAGTARAESGYVLDLERYLEQIMGEWHTVRPVAQVDCHFDGVRPAPSIVVDKTLKQAFFNLLNNAADASVESVEVRGEWNTEKLVFDVCDRGTGFEPAAQAHIGTPHFTTKKEGQGLGIFLSQAVIKRFGGDVQYAPRDGGGIRTRIILPLTRLAAPLPV